MDMHTLSRAPGRRFVVRSKKPLTSCVAWWVSWLGVLSGDEAYGVANLLGEAAQVANAGWPWWLRWSLQRGISPEGVMLRPRTGWARCVGRRPRWPKDDWWPVLGRPRSPKWPKPSKRATLPDQLKLVTETAAVAPESSGPLLALVAEGASHGALAGEANRQRAAARKIEDERQMRQRVHNGRHLRWRQDPNGGIRGDFWCDEVAWSKVNGRLEAETQARWKAAGSGDSTSLEATGWMPLST